MKNNRMEHLDYLRLLSIITVIVSHTALESWASISVNSSAWPALNFFSCYGRWSVPLFVMISGALLLPREDTLKKLYSKRILRLAVSFCVWSAFYAIAVPLLLNPGAPFSLKATVTSLIRGEVHMWFVPMTIALYMCLPLLRPITSSKTLTKYFLLLSFIFSLVIPTVKNLSNDFGSGLLAECVNAMHGLVGDMFMFLVVGFTFYFVAGHYIEQEPLSKKLRIVIYIAGIVGYISTFLLTLLLSTKNQRPTETYLGNFFLNVALPTLAIFTWLKYCRFPWPKLNAVVSKLSKYSFGAYLVHIFVQKVLTKVGFTPLSFSPFFAVLTKSAIVAVISFGISWLISKIPFVNKWIV